MAFNYGPSKQWPGQQQAQWPGQSAGSMWPGKTSAGGGFGGVGSGVPDAVGAVGAKVGAGFSAPPPDPGKGSSYMPADYGQQPATTPEEGVLSGPGYGEDWYKKYGEDLMKTPSSSEDLYSRGVAGSNPFYDHAQEQAVKGINDASAARGNFNSSYTMKNIGNTIANIRGMQAKELGQLAGQADQGKFGRYDRGSGYSGRAQGLTEDRVRGSLDAYGDLARSQAGLVAPFYGKAGDQFSMANLASIEAALKASGMDSAEAKAYIDFLTTAGGIVAKS